MTTDVNERNLSGWLKQPEDPRDFPLHLYRPDLLMAALPGSADLRGASMPPIQNQGSLGSCVAWACVRAYRYVQRMSAFPDLDGSELFTYYGARVLGGFPANQDTGAYLRDGIKALAQNGNAPEATWPYNVSLFAEQPSVDAYGNATLHQATRYLAVQNMEPQVKSVVASGYPLVFGIPIYQNFPQGNGVETIPMPQGQVIGGHAMCVVGYDDARQAYLLANSWGPSWGVSGFAWMPYAYFNSQASDLWMIETVEGEVPPVPPPPPTPVAIPFYVSFIRYDLMSDGAIWTATGRYNPPV